MNDRRVAIIGGGASCVLLLAHLARQPPSATRAITIDVYDRSGRFGRGVAYNTPCESHSLNVRAANMSAFQDDRDDFINWWKNGEGGGFASRPVYARYLNQRLEDALRTLNVRFLTENVQSSQMVSGDRTRFAVHGNEREMLYDDVILATGNVRAIQPRVEGDVPAFKSTPFDNETYESIPPSGEVILLGSGLSTVDALTSLKLGGFEGNITVISRHGWLPQRHADPLMYEGHMTDEELSLPPSGIMKVLRTHIVQAEKSSIPWQSVMDHMMRPVTNQIWKNWTAKQRGIFMRHGLTAWNVHRHRMSGLAAESVQYYQDLGRLKIVHDSIIRIESPGRVVCKKTTLAGDVIINCLGYRYYEGRTLDASYKIGPAAFGDLFETTAIPEIRMQAHAIAQKLIQ